MDVQLEKTFFPILPIEFGIVTLFKFFALEKADSLILVTVNSRFI